MPVGIVESIVISGNDGNDGQRNFTAAEHVVRADGHSRSKTAALGDFLPHQNPVFSRTPGTHNGGIDLHAVAAKHGINITRIGIDGNGLVFPQFLTAT